MKYEELQLEHNFEYVQPEIEQFESDVVNLTSGISCVFPSSLETTHSFSTHESDLSLYSKYRFYYLNVILGLDISFYSSIDGRYRIACFNDQVFVTKAKLLPIVFA